MSIPDVPQSLASHVFTREQMNSLRSGHGLALSDLSPDQREALAALSPEDRATVEGLLRAAAANDGITAPDPGDAAQRGQGGGNGMALGRYDAAQLAMSLPFAFGDVAPPEGVVEPSPAAPDGAARTNGSVDQRLEAMSAGRDLRANTTLSVGEAERALARTQIVRLRGVHLRDAGPRGVGTASTNDMNHYDFQRAAMMVRGDLSQLDCLASGPSELAQQYRHLADRLNTTDFADKRVAAELYHEITVFCEAMATADLDPAQSRLLQADFAAYMATNGSLDTLVADLGFDSLLQAQEALGLPATGTPDTRTYVMMRTSTLAQTLSQVNANEGLAFEFVQRQAQEARKEVEPLIAEFEELQDLRRQLTNPDGSVNLDDTALATLGVSRNQQGQFVRGGRPVSAGELVTDLETRIADKEREVETHLGRAETLIEQHGDEMLPQQRQTLGDIVRWQRGPIRNAIDLFGREMGRRHFGGLVTGTGQFFGQVGKMVGAMGGTVDGETSSVGGSPGTSGATGQVDALPFSEPELRDLSQGRMSIHDMNDDQRAFIERAKQESPDLVHIDAQGMVTVDGLDETGIQRLVAAEEMLRNPPNALIAEILNQVGAAVVASLQLELLENAALEAAALADEVTAYLEALIAELQAENEGAVLVFPDLQGATSGREEGAAAAAAGDLARARATDHERQLASGSQWLDLLSRPAFAPGRLAELVEQRAAQLQHQDRQTRQSYEAALERSQAERDGRPVLTSTAPAP